MLIEKLPSSLTRLVTPSRLKNYARALHWVESPDVNGTISVFHRPDSRAYQVVIPLDDSLEDYGDSVSEVVNKLAAFEGRPANEVLNHLLLPPADILRLRESSPDSETGTLYLDQAFNVLDGARRMLLAVAHSVLHPQAYHPRLSRSEADAFVKNCRLGQTERGSFVVTVACPLDIVPGTLFSDDPFARQITQGLMTTLNAITAAAASNHLEELVSLNHAPLLSANLCDAILQLRPQGERSRLGIAVTWSKAIPSPTENAGRVSAIELSKEIFDVVEYLGPRLRAIPTPKEEPLVGFVDVLRGQPDETNRMAGEAIFSLVLPSGETIRARADLSADDYQKAGDAHLHHAPIFLTGFLTRSARVNRIDDVKNFQILRQVDMSSEQSKSPL